MFRQILWARWHTFPEPRLLCSPLPELLRAGSASPFPVLASSAAVVLGEQVGTAHNSKDTGEGIAASDVVFTQRKGLGKGTADVRAIHNTACNARTKGWSLRSQCGCVAL